MVYTHKPNKCELNKNHSFLIFFSAFFSFFPTFLSSFIRWLNGCGLDIYLLGSCYNGSSTFVTCKANLENENEYESIECYLYHMFCGEHIRRFFFRYMFSLLLLSSSSLFACLFSSGSLLFDLDRARNIIGMEIRCA